MLIDTHAHLCDAAFDSDRETVLIRAREAGVVVVVAVAESLPEARRNLALAELHPGIVRPAAGLFPTRLDFEEAAALTDWIRRHREALYAVGEVGLDFWKVQESAERAVQGEIFDLFIDLAIELDLPLNVHSRAAGRPTIDRLLTRGAQRVQLHAFDGRAANALPGVAAGFFFSIPPSIVRSSQKQKLVRRLPVDCLLVETDSPVLGPDPERRNEPVNVLRSVAAIAEVKGLPVSEVAAAVTENTLRLYGDRLLASKKAD
jgi:TatD DNase family protein